MGVKSDSATRKDNPVNGEITTSPPVSKAPESPIFLTPDTTDSGDSGQSSNANSVSSGMECRP